MVFHYPPVAVMGAHQSFGGKCRITVHPAQNVPAVVLIIGLFRRIVGFLGVKAEVPGIPAEKVGPQFFPQFL